MTAHKLALNGKLWEWRGDSLGILLAERSDRGLPKQ
jgi:hypothetical protein